MGFLQERHKFLGARAMTTGKELTLTGPTIDGHRPFLPAGILHDTSTSIQGTAPTIQRSGAVVRGEPGKMKFLQVDPRSGTFVAWNPLPDLARFSFSIPGGAKIQADGQIGIARVEIDAKDSRVFVSHTFFKEGQDRDTNAATALVLTGFRGPPIVEYNGAVLTDLMTRVIRGQAAYLVPLREITQVD